MRSFNSCSYIMKFLRLALVDPGGTLVQPGEASFARGGGEFDAQNKSPLSRTYLSLTSDKSICPTLDK